MHGSMSAHEMRCVLLARGPSFRDGLETETPSGNVDLAPTVLRALGIAPPAMDGRVLKEAFRGGADPAELGPAVQVHEARRALADGVYRQSITVSTVEGTRYVDSGSASFSRL